tara:strand:+ start:296 stop:754 length:459 start_codon:yes stop_codon:yes gene_type:complete
MSELGSWWSPYRITYTSSQIVWLLEHIVELREGIWPSNPEGRSSGYIDPKIRVSGEYNRFSETVGIITGTLERRLLKTGLDGAMAYLRHSVELSYNEIAKLFHIPTSVAWERVNLAIKFCTRRYDKKSTYSQYKKIRHDYIYRKQKAGGLAI